jgi:hypothetical protein
MILAASVSVAERMPRVVGVAPLVHAANAAEATNASADGRLVGEPLVPAVGATSQTATSLDGRGAPEPLGSGSAESKPPNASGAITGVPSQSRRVMKAEARTRVADPRRETSAAAQSSTDQRSTASTSTADTALPSTQIAVVADRASATELVSSSQPVAIAPLVSPPAPSLGYEPGIAAHAATVGAVSREAAGRAGTSVARFFRRGGHAVAKRL